MDNIVIAVVLLDIKSILNTAFSSYILPTIGACMAIGFGGKLVANWARYKEDLLQGLQECGVAALYGLLGGAVLVGIVEGFKAIKVTF
jgi:hypothetical protein